MEAGRLQGEQPLGADGRWRSSGIEQPGISFHPEARRSNPEFQCGEHKLKPSSLNASTPFRSCRTPTSRTGGQLGASSTTPEIVVGFHFAAGDASLLRAAAKNLVPETRNGRAG